MTDRKFQVGLLATHPIQYYAPWYRALARAVDLQVFYCHRQTPEQQGEAGFGLAFDWDVPLLDGYRHRFLVNRARRPNASSVLGCDSPEIGQIIRQERFDAFIVHGWAIRSYWQAMVACWQSGTPVLVRGDSQRWSSGAAVWRLAKYPLYRLFIPRFDAYLIVGDRARQYLLNYGANPRRMFFVPHAVDNDFFSSRADSLRPERRNLQAALGVPCDATVFLFVGKFIAKKRPEDFARAVAKAAGSQPRVWGLMVGDGPLRAVLKSMAKADGWPVRFPGFLNQTELPQAYAASDALVLPSSYAETWGLVVNEAMASGLPAIVSDQVGCGPDLVRPSETGEVYAYRAVDELAAVMVRLAADPSRLASLGANARRCVQRYSVDQAVRGTLEAIESSVVSEGLASPVRGHRPIRANMLQK